MKLVFAGTPAFAVPSLKALLAAGHEIAAVLTQPDRPAGRGRQRKTGPVKQLALERGLRLLQPTDLADAVPTLAALAPQAMIVVAYGLLLPKTVLAIPQYGCINVHASLLPRWRGAAPVARAIEAGDERTGVCIMQMEAGLDTGPVYACRELAIGETETAAQLETRLAELGAALLIDTLKQIADQDLTPTPQPAIGATYARKLRKEEGAIDWRESAAVLQRKIRALNPWPVATTQWRGRTLRLWEVAPLVPPADGQLAPGTVVAAGSDGLTVQAGEGSVTVTRLQLEGGRPLPAGEFLNGCRIAPGEHLGGSIDAP